MTKASILVFSALSACALVTSGCYTVLKSPYAASAIGREPVYASSQWDEGALGDRLSPRVGRGIGRDDDRYGYGPDGYPMSGYDSRFGPYGSYGFGSGYSGAPGYGYGGYSAGYGPHGYGYDPYYRGVGGVYIPPGYELVTTEELDRLRTDTTVLSTLGSAAVPTAGELRDLQMQQQEEERQIWTQRKEKLRPAPSGLTRRPSSTTSSGGGSKKSAKSTAKPSSSSSESKGSKKTAQPAKKGR